MNNNLSMYMGRDRITALKLSKETGISRSAIHGLYHERTKSPDMQTVMKLCDYFKVTPNEFFGIKEKERPRLCHM
ncbi:helix-turn-helix domain-containing protein [Staphylococcus epidermidis]